MSYKLCLRCGGDCASYASQCIHCHHSFKQPYVQNKNDNDKVVLLLTQWREGQSLEGIAASLNSAGIQPLNSDLPWSPQSVAHVIHRFTTTGLDSSYDAGITRCQQCRAPLIGETCDACTRVAPEAAPAQNTSVGLTALIYNIVIIAVVSLFIFYCKNYMNDGEGFHSNFIGLFLSIGALFAAGALLLFGNIAFIILALATSNKK